MKKSASGTYAPALLLGSAIALAAGQAAAADAASDVQSKIEAAMKAAKSFVVMTQLPTQGYASTLVYVAPDRYRVAVAIAASTTDVITIGDTAYSSKNGAPFEKASVSSEQSARLKSIGQIKIAAMRPDVSVDGVTYGEFDASAPAGESTSLTCRYDKKKFRLIRCGNSSFTETFDGYDDPNNLVGAPDGGK